jgi:hypothetical protein
MAKAQQAASPPEPATPVPAATVLTFDPVRPLAQEIYLRRVVAGATATTKPEAIAEQAFVLAAAFLDYAASRPS